VTDPSGGFELLIASSQDVAASTIQLVVASQVRAERSSPNLKHLKQASTSVKTATANVVATAKDCAQLIEESGEYFCCGLHRGKTECSAYGKSICWFTLSVLCNFTRTIICVTTDEVDLAKLTTHNAKRMELETQAEVLRLQSDLEKARVKLTTLRQHHYHNADD